MHPSSSLTQGSVAYRVPRVTTRLMLLALGCWGIATLVHAMPGIIRQFAQPCAGCYVGAFESPLQPYRNPVNPTDSRGMAPPGVKTWQVSAAGMAASQPAGQGHWLLLATEQMSNRLGQGATMQDDGGMQGEFYAIANRRGYAPAFTRSALDGRDGRIVDPVATVMWAGVSTGSFAGYHLNVPSLPEAAKLAGALSPIGPSDGLRQASDRYVQRGIGGATGTSWTQGAVPYWRVAVQKNLQQHFLQISTYGLNASQLATGSYSDGRTERFTDHGADANYQLILAPGGSSIISAHSVVLHETRPLDAGTRANGILGFDTVRADVSWGIADTVIPSIQYFRSAGSIEATQFLWLGARPHSAGLIAGVTYMPWNSAGSPIQFLNLRLAAQYVSYTELNGNAHGASANNSMYFSLWGALRF